MFHTLNIIDSITSQPVSGAQVYVVYSPGNGSCSTYKSDSSGNVSLPYGQANIAINAVGYTQNTFGFSQLDSATLDVTQVALIPAASATAHLSFTVTPISDQTHSSLPIPSSNGAVLTILQGADALEALNVSSDGTARSAKAYSAGTYTVIVAQTGFNLLTQAVTLTATSGSVQVLTLTQTKTAPVIITAVASSTPYVGATPAAVDPDLPYEYIYPNSADGKYFQATQARMYIGNQFVDELNLCQWTASQNRIPIYGYRSDKFDAMGRGRSLVQGQLAVNFISEGYMYILLQEFNRKISSKLGASLGKTTSAGISQDLQTQINTIFSTRTRLQSLGSDVLVTQLNTQLVNLAGTSPAAAAYINSVKASLLDATGTLSSSSSHQNAIYLDIPFDIVVKLEGGGRTVERTLKTCFLGANDFTFAQDGKTLLDSYSFTARSVT